MYSRRLKPKPTNRQCGKKYRAATQKKQAC